MLKLMVAFDEVAMTSANSEKPSSVDKHFLVVFIDIY